MNNKKQYRINEIFYSIQGEGFFTGHASIFIRFSGCNMNCSFCDTKHNAYVSMDIDDIYERAVEASPKCKRIVFTGGEPMIQLDDNIIDFFKNKKYILHVETNGSIVKDFLDKLDWITVSPKLKTYSEIGRNEAWNITIVDDRDWKLRWGDELKVVYQGQNLNMYIERIEEKSFRFLYLQPCSMQNIRNTIVKIKNNPQWALSLQTQKMLNIQ